MVTKKRTFADRAKAIKAKYSRADFDKIEREDMIKELKALKEEQESFRIDNGLDQEEGEEQAYGGLFRKTKERTPAPGYDWHANGGSIFDYSTSQWLKPRGGYTNYPWGGGIDPTAMSIWNNSKFISPMTGTTPIQSISGPNNLAWSPTPSPTYNVKMTSPFTGLQKTQPNSTPNPITPPTKLATTTPQQTPWKGVETSPTASAISTGISLLGNATGMIANNKKNRPGDVSLPRMTPTTINMEPQREALRRDYHNALNIALNRSRSASNESNAYANQIGAITGLTDSLGSKMSESALSEAQANAAYQNQASQMNTEVGAREALTNAQQNQYYNQLQSGYRDELFGTIPKALQDYRAQYSQDMMMNTFGKDYGIRGIQPQNSWERFKYSLLGQPYIVAKRQV